MKYVHIPHNIVNIVRYTFPLCLHIISGKRDCSARFRAYSNLNKNIVFPSFPLFSSSSARTRDSFCNSAFLVQNDDLHYSLGIKMLPNNGDENTLMFSGMYVHTEFAEGLLFVGLTINRN